MLVAVRMRVRAPRDLVARALEQFLGSLDVIIELLVERRHERMARGMRRPRPRTRTSTIASVMAYQRVSLTRTL